VWHSTLALLPRVLEQLPVTSIHDQNLAMRRFAMRIFAKKKNSDTSGSKSQMLSGTHNKLDLSTMPKVQLLSANSEVRSRLPIPTLP
jgi:hypothetical protein